uniref:beta-catenin-interacting protein 1 isoform X2 n=1 Tax=Nyctereutes procyonoides TaxID=34880 RepID=UPI002444801E|nr:beta-catenin-interacting protein 1 isoform X2 [Nyctereutes procyonoides]
MNREGAPGKSPEEMYIQQKVRVLLMLRKMGSNLTANEEEFLRTYAGVVNSQLSQLPQHSIDQATLDLGMTVLVRNPGWVRTPPMASEELPGGTAQRVTVVDQVDDSTLQDPAQDFFFSSFGI